MPSRYLPTYRNKEGEIALLGADGRFSLHVEVGDYYTISTVRSAQHGAHGPSEADNPPSRPAFATASASSRRRMTTG